MRAVWYGRWVCLKTQLARSRLSHLLRSVALFRSNTDRSFFDSESTLKSLTNTQWLRRKLSVLSTLNHRSHLSMCPAKAQRRRLAHSPRCMQESRVKLSSRSMTLESRILTSSCTMYDQEGWTTEHILRSTPSSQPFPHGESFSCRLFRSTSPYTRLQEGWESF